MGVCSAMAGRLAILAESVQFHLVAVQFEPETTGHGVLQFLYPGILKLYDLSAGRTDTMVVVGNNVLVEGLTVTKVALVHQACVTQESHRPVDRRKPYVRIDTFYLGMNVVDADVALGGKKPYGDVVTLLGGL